MVIQLVTMQNFISEEAFFTCIAILNCDNSLLLRAWHKSYVKEEFYKGALLCWYFRKVPACDAIAINNPAVVYVVLGPVLIHIKNTGSEEVVSYLLK